MLFAFWPPSVLRGRAAAGGVGAILSTVHILSQLWKTMHSGTQLHQRGRLPRIMETLDSCLWLRTHAVVKCPMKTIRVPKTYLPILLTLELQERKTKQKKIFLKKILYDHMPLKCVPRPIFGPGYNKTIIRQIFTVYTSNMNTEPVHPPLSPWLLYLPWHYRDYVCHACGCIRKLWSYVHDF